MKFMFGVFMFFCTFAAHSAGFDSEEKVKTFANRFMDQVISEDFKEAFDTAKPYWPLPVVEIDGMVNTINQQWPVVQQRFGESVGKEFLKEERIGKSFLRYYFLHKFKNHAIYWQLDFYKATNQWNINSFQFLDNLDVLFE